MNKLFLASSSIQKHQVGDLLQLCGVQNKSDIKMLLIENATDVYEEGRKGFVYGNRNSIKEAGLTYELLDLREYVGNIDDLRAKIEKNNVLWVGGGNCFYLREIFQKSGFDTLGNFLQEQGIVYAGGSAGIVVLTPNIEGYGIVDDPSMAGQQIYDGLGWIEEQLIPHWGEKKFQRKLEEIQSYFKEKGDDILLLQDGQVAVYEDGNYKIIN